MKSVQIIAPYPVNRHISRVKDIYLLVAIWQLKQEQVYVSLKSDIYLCNTGTYSSWMFDSVAANRDRISQIIYSQIPNVYIDYKYQGFE